MRVGISIEKSVLFRGGQQPFANVYYYDAALPVSDPPGWNHLVDALVTLEKSIHSTEVTFVRARCWKADGSKSENVMIIDKAISGTGTKSVSTTMDRERAAMISIRAGVDTKGRPVYNRKWFHICAGVIGAESISNDQLKQTASLSAGQQATLAGVAEDLKEMPAGATGTTPASLTSKSGRNVTGAGTSHRFLEHHQLGDAWRSV